MLDDFELPADDVSSGYHRPDELKITEPRSLYYGSALVILRSTESPGSITLKVTANGFKPTIIQLKTTEQPKYIPKNVSR